MENRTRVSNPLDLVIRADKLATSEGLTLKDIRTNKAKFVFIAQDASENTRKKIKDKGSYYNAPVNEPFSQSELGQTTERPRMVTGITDAGFATKIKELLKGQESDRTRRKRIYELTEEMSKASRDVVDRAY